MTAGEFYAAFASIFRLSDGSKISAPRKEKTESLRYMQELMYMVGVHVNKSAGEMVNRPSSSSSSSSSPSSAASSNGTDQKNGPVATESYPGDILQICGTASRCTQLCFTCVCVCVCCMLTSS